MNPEKRVYLAIDLKSFYASVECRTRGLDPLTTNLVVADASRTEKTICLAVSPSLKAHGIPGRPRLFEVVQRIKEVNAQRLRAAPNGRFTGKSSDARRLANDPSLELDVIVAPPRMATYVKISSEIYKTYLDFIAPQDIHVYSIDEVFIDATVYLERFGVTAHELARRLILAVLNRTGITATAGIGTNLYLCKVAMDIVAKHIPPDKDGVRIAELDERSFREKLWRHRPLTDFWRIGGGTARHLERLGLRCLGDVCAFALQPAGETILYKHFGVNAELLVDHAWGWESCTMADIKAYRPAANSISSGQVLQEPYSFEKAALVVREMADTLSLDLVSKRLVTDQIGLAVGFDIENLSDPARRAAYKGEVVVDHYGRRVPRPVNGSASLGRHTSSTRDLVSAFNALFNALSPKGLLVRRLTLSAGHVIPEADVPSSAVEQLDLFTDYAARAEEEKREAEKRERERRGQEAILALRARFGKNAVLKGMNLTDGATTRQRNEQIGGHKA